MFKQGDVVKVKGYKGLFLFYYAHGGTYAVVTNAAGQKEHVHLNRVSKAKVKKVTGVYQLVKKDVTRGGNDCICQVFNGSENVPCIGSLSVVEKRAVYMRKLHKDFTYQVLRLIITPAGTTVELTNY